MKNRRGKRPNNGPGPNTAKWRTMSCISLLFWKNSTSIFASVLLGRKFIIQTSNFLVYLHSLCMALKLDTIFSSKSASEIASFDCQILTLFYLLHRTRTDLMSQSPPQQHAWTWTHSDTNWCTAGCSDNLQTTELAENWVQLGYNPRNQKAACCPNTTVAGNEDSEYDKCPTVNPKPPNIEETTRWRRTRGSAENNCCTSVVQENPTPPNIAKTTRRWTSGSAETTAVQQLCRRRTRSSSSSRQCQMTPFQSNLPKDLPFFMVSLLIWLSQNTALTLTSEPLKPSPKTNPGCQKIT